MGIDRQKLGKYIEAAQWALYARSKARQARGLRDHISRTTRNASYVKGQADRIISEGPDESDFDAVKSIAKGYAKSRAERAIIRGVRKVNRGS